MLPANTILGDLRVLEVYEDYDGPRLFLAENSATHKFLCVWLGTKERIERWLYVPISDARLRELRTGALELRAGFAQPEGDAAVRVEIDRATGEARTELVPASSLTDADLPEAGEPLTDEPLPDDPRFANRELLELALDLPDKSKEGPLALVGSFLHALQKTVDAIGEALAEKFEGLQPIAAFLRQQTALALAETYRSSFGMRVTSTAPPELFADSLVSRSMAEFVELLDAGANEEALHGMLRKLHRRTAIRYGALLTFVQASGADLKVRWRAGRSHDSRRATLSCADAARVLAILKRHEEQNPIVFEVVGQLTQISMVPSRSFRVDVLGQDTSYKGTITDEGVATAGHATIMETYRARIREIPEASAVTDEITRRYELLSLTPV
jgi:hypothetical protein